MIIHKVRYRQRGDIKEGYFIKTRKGYVQVLIEDGQLLEFQEVLKESEVDFNQITLKMEEVDRTNSYFA